MSYRPAVQRALRKKRSALSSALCRLELARDKLLMQKRVLEALVETLDQLRQSRRRAAACAAAAAAGGQADEPQQPTSDDAFDEIDALLRASAAPIVDGAAAAAVGAASSGSSSGGSGGMRGDESAGHADDAPCAPPDRPMLFMQRLLALPPHPSAAAATPEALMRHYQQLLPQLALQMSLADNPHARSAMAAAGQHALHALVEQLIVNHYHLLMSLGLLYRRVDLMNELLRANVATGVLLTPDEVVRRDAQHAWVVDQLVLSPEARRRIAYGSELFDRLLAPVHRELALVQRAAVTAAAGGETMPAASAAAAAAPPQEGSEGRACAANGGTAAATPTTAADDDDDDLGALGGSRSACLEEARVTRGAVVLAKVGFVACAYFAYVLGCLSHAQVARAAVLCVPFHPGMLVLGSIVAARQRQQDEEVIRRAGFGGRAPLDPGPRAAEAEAEAEAALAAKAPTHSVEHVQI